MSLIHCKVESKLKWTKDFVLAAVGVNNVDADSNDIILLSKTQIYMSLFSHYQQNTIKNCQNLLAKDLKYQCIGINMRQKVRIKIREISLYILSNQTFWELTDCLFWFI